MKFLKIIIPLLIVLAIIPIMYIEKNNDRLINTSGLTDAETFDMFVDITNTNWDEITTSTPTNIYGINKTTKEIQHIIVTKNDNYETFAYKVTNLNNETIIRKTRVGTITSQKGPKFDDFNYYETKPASKLIDDIPLGNLIPLVLIAGLLTYLYVGVKQGKDE